MRTINVKKVKDVSCLEAVLGILSEIYNIRIKMSKPRLSWTFEIVFDGQDEDKAYSIFMIFAAKAGWKIT